MRIKTTRPFKKTGRVSEPSEKPLAKIIAATNERSVPVQPPGCPTAGQLTRTINSADLFGDARTVLIDHAGEQYRLIVTKNGKLLLQK